MLAVHLSKQFAQSIDLSMLKQSELLDMVLLLLCQLKVSSNSKTEVKKKPKKTSGGFSSYLSIFIELILLFIYEIIFAAVLKKMKFSKFGVQF